jgi:radical SAM-linked protein
MNDFRIRIKFAKLDRLAMLAHLELARAMERAVRRAGLPYALSNGFNAHMKVAFGPALPVGTASLGEYFDLILTSYIPADKVVAALQAATPPSLPVLDAHCITKGTPSLQVSHVYQRYELTYCARGQNMDAIQEALDALLATDELTVKRQKKTRTYILHERIVAPIEVSDGCLKLQMRSIDGSSVKPEALCAAAFANLDPAPQITSITRTELCEEL